jgi:hypothetical protein
MLNTQGWVLTEIGAEAGSRASNVAATELAREVGDPEIIANSNLNLALNHLAAGEMDEAGVVVAGLQAEVASAGDPWMRWRWAMHVDDAAGRLALAHRDPAAALAAGDRELAAAHRRGARKIEARAQSLRATALLALERLDDADQAARDSLARAVEIGHAGSEWRALRLAAEVARRRGRSDVATEAGRRVAARVASLADALPDDELRRALYAAAGVGHDARP